MTANSSLKRDKRESIFLNGHFMVALCAVVVVTGLVSLFFVSEKGIPSRYLKW